MCCDKCEKFNSDSCNLFCNCEWGENKVKCYIHITYIHITSKWKLVFKRNGIEWICERNTPTANHLNVGTYSLFSGCSSMLHVLDDCLMFVVCTYFNTKSFKYEYKRVFYNVKSVYTCSSQMQIFNWIWVAIVVLQYIFFRIRLSLKNNISPWMHRMKNFLLLY